MNYTLPIQNLRTPILKKIVFVLTILFSSIPFFSYSTHIIGGELNYKCLGNNLYEVKVRVFRDCNKASNAAYDATAAVGIFDVNNVLVTTLYINFPGATVITPTIAQQNPCVKIPLNTCVEVAEYITTVTLPPRVGGYQLVYQRCCRNATINNINNPGGQGATYTALIPGPAITCNSNPVFTKMPPLFVCADNQLVFDNSATDAEGDSISYSICTPFNGANSGPSMPQPPNAPPYNFITFKAPYSASNPMGGVALAINPTTGLLTGTPSTLGQFVVGVCANEYRNGVLLSTTKRDFQFNVVSCEPDVAAAAAAFISDCTNHTVTFTNNSTGSATYEWNFGDPTTTADVSTLTNPTYTYPTAGTFTVTLIAFSTAGNACNDTLKNFIVVVDTCQPCGMTLGITKVDATCSPSSACSVTPISTSQWNSAIPPNPNPCPGAGYFVSYAQPSCTVDPYGTSPDECYYVCGVSASAISNIPWSSCTEDPATPCPGKSAMVLGRGSLGQYSYICPCETPVGVCTHIVWTYPCSSGTQQIYYYGDAGPASRSCLSAGTSNAVTTGLTPSSVDLRIGGVTQAQLPVSPPAVITTLTNTHATCPKTASITTTGGAGGTATFDYYLWVVSGSSGPGAPGSATVTPSAGTAPYNYSWGTSPVQTTATATNLTAGTYTVTVTDAAGCTKTSVVTVDASATIVLAQSQTALSSCGASDGTASVTASGGSSPYTYLWSNGQTNATATGLSAGAYTVNVTDANGCSKSTTFTINQPVTITVSAAKTDVLCGNPINGTATATPGGGTGPYTYLWSNGQTTNPAVGLNAGYYIVTATDVSGCYGTAAVTITNSVLALSSSKTDVRCYAGNTGTASVTASNGTPGYTYSWNTVPVQTNATATNLSVGTYIVTVTDNGGCSRSASLTVSEPAPIDPEPSNTSTVNCAGTTNGSANVIVNGGTAPFTYSWCNAQTTSAATALPQGKCTITITDANLCSATDTVDIIYPLALSLTQLTSDATCSSNNGSAIVSPSGGQPGYTYSWTTAPGQTTQTAVGLSAGTYTVVVTDNAGCSSALTNVVINQSGSGIIIAQSTTTAGCGLNNGTASATASGGTPNYTYSWNTSPVQTTQTATGLSAGTYVVVATDNTGCTSSTSVAVTSSSAPSAVTSSVAVSCNNGNNGTATVTASGGSGTYTYSWNTSPVQTTVTATGLTSGTYSVTVTDNAGCVFVTSVTVNQPTPINISSGNTTAGCGLSNGTVSATASGGTPNYTYSWNTSPVQTTQTATGVSAGTYIVVVTDNSGCTSSASVAVNNSGGPTATTGSTNVSCNGGSNGTVTVTASGGSGTYSYSWNTSPIQTTITATGLTQGTYSVTVTDNAGCIFITSVTVNQPTLITIAQSTTTAGCNLSNGTASATASGGTPNYTYSWNTSPVQTTQTATGVSAGTYIVIATDNLGCTTSASVAVTNSSAPGATISSVAVACNGGNNGTATVTASGGSGVFTYSWNTSPVQTTITATGLTPGTYTVTVTDNAGCIFVTSVTVSQPTTITLVSSQTIVSCNGGSNGTATVTASGGNGGYTYNWLPSAQTTQTASGLSAGTYTITVTDSKGCTASLTNINIAQATAISIAKDSTASNCSGGGGNGTATITASGGTSGYSYLWNTNPVQTNSLATGLSIGTYSVIVSDANGCTSASSVTIIGQGGVSVVAAFTETYVFDCDDEVFVSFANLSTNATSYLWNFGDGDTSTLEHPTHTYPYGSTVTVTLIAMDGGCADTTTLNININAFDDYIMPTAPNVFTPNGDGTNDCFEVQVGNGLEKCVEIIIFDRWGLRLYDTKTGGACWDGRTTAGNLATEGTYFYLIKIGNYEAHGALSLFR